MRVRRAMNVGDLRAAPIDRVDAFLLTRLVDTLSLSELVEIAPCRAEEVRGRIEGLAQLGLVELLASNTDERLWPAPMPTTDDMEETVTLRPPPHRVHVAEDALTLWPKMKAPLTLDLEDFADPPQTGVRQRPPPFASEATSKSSPIARRR